MFNWNDLESFLSLARNKKLVACSKKLKIEATTISRRITRLEQKLGEKLFFRSNNLYILTDNGKRLFSHAEKIESETFIISEQFINKNINLSGSVRVAAPEGFGVEIFSNYLEEFYRRYPDLEIELIADTRSRNLLNREIDISITLSQPKTGNLICKKLGNYRLNLYATKKYLNSNATINSINDLENHNFISYIDDLIDFPELKYLDDLKRKINVVFRSNSLNAQINAVQQNIGLALLHSFMTKNKNNLVKVLPEVINVTREYWIVIHENLFQLKRIKVVSDFLTRIIEKEKSVINNKVIF